MIGNMSGDWEELRDDFCYSFSLTECIDSLSINILDFEQLEKESIGAAWARFSRLLASIPDMSIPDEVSLEVFYSGLDMETALELDDASGGWFMHTTLEEGRDILDSFIENSFFSTDHSEPHREESASSRVSQHPNLSLHLPHPNIRLLSPLPNHEHRRKKKFNLRSSLPDSRVNLQKHLES